MATTQQDVIKKFMTSLDKTTKNGTAALDEAIQACSNSKFKNAQAVITKMITDCKKSESADYFLKNYCGINLDNEDTGAITGLDMGGVISKNAKDIVLDNGGLDTNFRSSAFNVDGLNISLRKFNDGCEPANYKYNGRTTLSFDELTTAQKYVWQGLKSWWTSGGLDLIAESYGNNYSFDENSSANIKGLHFG